MWFYLALLSAFFNGLGNVARRTHGSLADPVELAWWTLLLSLPLGVGLLLTSNEPFYTSTAFIMPVVISAFLSAVASVFQFKAYKLADASVISPITNFLPLLLVVTSFLILGIKPSALGLVGILLVVSGVYYSSVNGRHSLAHPLKQIFKSKGSRAMLITVLLWSVGTVVDKIALRTASASFILLWHQVEIFLLISAYLLVKPQKRRLKRGERVLKRWGWHIAAISLFVTLAVFFQIQAVKLMDPSYVISVKRLDVLFTVIFAGLFLGEKHIFKRFTGSLIALVGIIVMYLFQ